MEEIKEAIALDVSRLSKFTQADVDLMANNLEQLSLKSEIDKLQYQYDQIDVNLQNVIRDMRRAETEKMINMDSEAQKQKDVINELLKAKKEEYAKLIQPK